MLSGYKLYDVLPSEYAEEAAILIMEAMGEECCRNFAASEYEEGRFRGMMKDLVLRENTQYSRFNTIGLVSERKELAGICLCYDGARLKEYRQAFIDSVLHVFGNDVSDMEDETQAGELYIDVLSVSPDFRNKGAGKILVGEAVQRAYNEGFAKIALIVDDSNQIARRLYDSLGFCNDFDLNWGGHLMHHMSKEL